MSELDYQQDHTILKQAAHASATWPFGRPERAEADEISLIDIGGDDHGGRNRRQLLRIVIVTVFGA